MLTRDQAQPAYDSLKQADDAFAAGDEMLGAQKLWEAFADAVSAAAQVRGLPCKNDNDILQVLSVLATPDRDYLNLRVAFSTAQRFRDAPARGGPEDYEVECLAPEIPRIVDELIALA